jgi:hypothetical protein
MFILLGTEALALSQGCMEDASDTRIQVNLILVELFGKYVPVHYLGVVSLGLDWQLNKDVSFSELINIIITFEINELIIFPVHLN